MQEIHPNSLWKCFEDNKTKPERFWKYFVENRNIHANPRARNQPIHWRSGEIHRLGGSGGWGVISLDSQWI